MTPTGAVTARRWMFPALWLLLTVALVLTVPRLPWSHAASVVAGAAPAWVALALLANASILPLWAAEWTVLVPGGTARFARVLEIVLVSAAVLNSVPMLAGEASAVALLVTRAGLSRGAALSVLALDQLLVAFAKISVLVVAALVSPVPPWVKAGLLTLAVAFTLLAFALVVLAHRGQYLAARVPAGAGWTTLAMTRVLSWGRHLEALRDARRALLVALVALAKKGAEIAAAIAVQVALGVPPDIAAATVVVAALALSTLVPIAPGNLGVYEATVYAVYRFFGVAPEMALALAVAQHLCFLLPSVLPGYFMLTLRQLAPGARRAG